MHILVTALGSAGDVHPFIAISQSLVARGHAVTILTSPNFEERIRRAGIDFAPMGAAGDYERVLQRPELWHPRRGARFILDELLDRLPDAYAATASLVRRGETLLVGSTLAWGARLVQERFGLPMATIHLSPLCIQSAIDPPVLPAIGDLSRWPSWSVRLLQRTIERVALDRWTAPRLNRFRDTLGLPPVDHVWSRWLHSPDLVVGAWPAWFAAAQPDWPPQAVTTGFPLFDEGRAALSPTLRAFLDAGPAPVGVTPGSAMAHGARFIEQAITACGALGHRTLLVTPFRDQVPASLPPGVHHVDYAPFSALLPRLAALIHHGGIGTSAQALAAGIPQMVVPFAHDQFDNAARLRRLGVSTTRRVDAPIATWVDGLRALSDDAQRGAVADRARSMEAESQTPERIADLLLRLGAERVAQSPASSSRIGQSGR